MLTEYCFSFLLIFSVSSANEDNSDIFYHNVEDTTINQSSNNVNSMDSVLTLLQNTIFLKLDAMEAKRSAKFAELEGKLDLLGITTHNLETSIHDKFYKLEKSILDKLEVYIDGKTDSAERHVYRKINELENNLPDKSDIKVITRKLDALTESKNTNNLGAIPICGSNTLNNETMEKTNKDITQKFEVLYKQITNLEENLITNLEENLSHRLAEIKNKIPEIEGNMNQKLDTLTRKIPEQLKETMDHKFVNIEEKIRGIKCNLICSEDTLNNTQTQNISHKLDEIQRIFPKLEHNINERIDDLETLERDIYSKVNEPDYWSCKSKKVTGFVYQPILMKNNTFNHVTMETDKNGSINFGMRLAIKAAEGAIIQLSPVLNFGKNDTYIAIHVEYGNKTEIHKSYNGTGALVGPYASSKTPDILSETKFTVFYIKLKNGTLEFGKADTASPPILKYTDELLRKVKYFGFSAWYTDATFLYDCPPNFNLEGAI